jgi:hypothetical protein
MKWGPRGGANVEQPCHVMSVCLSAVSGHRAQRRPNRSGNLSHNLVSPLSQLLSPLRFFDA